MKKERKKLSLIDELAKDAEQKVSEVFNKIKPDIDRVIEAVKKSRDVEKSLTYPKLTPPPSNPNINQESRGLVSTVNAIFINNDGDLYKKPKEKYCYNMQTSKIRLEIVKYLINYPNYNNVSDIKRYVGSLSEKSIMESIRAINRNISHRLKVEDFIEARQGSGYRINPKFEIVFE